MVKRLSKKKLELKFPRHGLGERISLFITFIFLSTFLGEQDVPCSYWPAPCPNTPSLEQEDDGPQRKQNGAIDQTLAFTRKMRNQLTDLMLKTAKQNHWRVYELMEDVFDSPPF